MHRLLSVCSQFATCCSCQGKSKRGKGWSQAHGAQGQPKGDGLDSKGLWGCQGRYKSDPKSARNMEERGGEGSSEAKAEVACVPC